MKTLKVLFAVGLLTAACMFFAPVTEVNAQTGDELALQGVSAFNRGDYAQAAALLEKSLKAGLDKYKDYQIYTILGNTYNSLDQFEKAIQAHRRSLALNPNYHVAWVNLGIVYRLMGDYGEAEKCYLKALSLEPDYAELHASLGALYIFKGETEKAVNSLEKSIKLDPHLAVAFGNLALAYAMANRFEEAQATLKRATILGYKNSAVIQERIDNLKALAHQ